MEGRVIKYFDEKGYGFIKDENGDSRFFHISDVKGSGEFFRGSHVKFTPDKNEKGLICVNVEVIDNKKTNFITIGDTSIKISNIKQFGVSTSDWKKRAIKAPLYELNPKYIEKKKKAGKSLFKRLLLPVKYIPLAKYVEYPINSVQDFDEQEYRLKYVFVKKSETELTRGNFSPFISKKRARVVYSKYLYITTYQNDNYQFYDDEINIDETLLELENMANR